MNVLQFLSPLAKSYSTLQSKQDVIRDMSVHNLEFWLFAKGESLAGLYFFKYANGL